MEEGDCRTPLLHGVTAHIEEDSGEALGRPGSPVAVMKAHDGRYDERGTAYSARAMFLPP